MVEMKVIALAWVAMIDSPMAYQGMVFPASRYLLTRTRTAAAPQSIGDNKTSHANRTTQSSVLIVAAIRARVNQ